MAKRAFSVRVLFYRRLVSLFASHEEPGVLPPGKNGKREWVEFSFIRLIALDCTGEASKFPRRSSLGRWRGVFEKKTVLIVI